MKEQPLKNSNNSTLLKPTPATRYQRLDCYLWEQSIREARHHLKAAPWMNQTVLDVYRVLCCVGLLSLSLYHIITNKDPTLLFFTNWGIFMTAISYTLFTASIIRERCGVAKMSPRDIYSPWVLWKWACFIYETTLIFEGFIIVPFFWLVLFPILLKKNIDPGPMAYVDHITPFAVMAVDYAFNRIPVHLRHLPLSLAVLLIYGVVNITKTLVTGKPVYDPLTFKDIMSLVWSLVLVSLLVIGFLVLSWLTPKKLAKARSIDRENGPAQIVDLSSMEISNDDAGTGEDKAKGTDDEEIQMQEPGMYSMI